MARKTLLIGLGGTGCSVVQQVKAMVGPNTQDIQFVGFDTDHSRAGKYGLDVIETGRNMLVEELLSKEPDAKDWFPYEPTLLNRNMQNGAGQVRTLSRLALKDTIRNQGVGRLEKAVDMLHTPGEDNDNVAFYVTIVSSFAGGTGSGMFISLALYLRRYILDTFGTNAIIDGVFALPDVFMDGKTDDVQRESMFANTFAALKELVNVNRVCLSRDPKANEIKMTYRAGKKLVFDSAIDRKDEKTPPVKMKPFDLMFFFDKVNSNRNVLPGGIEEYLRCMAQAVFMRCFAPVIQDTVRSREDNLSVSYIESNNENRFGSLGTAKLIYPYADILRYCDLRSASDTIGECWSAPEADYKRRHQEELAQNKLNREAKVRSRGEVYIAWVDANDKQPEFSFLQAAITQAPEQDADTEKAEFESKADAYFDIVERYIRVEAENEVGLPEKTKIGALESMSHGKVVDRVKKTEREIKASFKKIKESFMVSAGYRIDAVFPQELHRLLPEFSQTGQENISNLLRKDGNAVHPLAARYLLYKVRDLFSTTRDTAKNNANKAELVVDQYIHKDWIPKTKNITESAEKAIPNAINLLGLQDFSRKYSSESVKAIDALSAYRINQLKYLVYEGVLKRLDLLITQYEQLFDLLPDLMKEMNAEIKLLVNKHNSVSMEQFVCASAEAKEQIYQSLDRPQENTISSPIYDSLLQCLCNYTLKILDRKQKAASRHQAIDKADEQYEKSLQSNEIKQLFNKELLPHYFKLLEEQEGNGSKLNKDIFTALDEEVYARAAAALRGNTDHKEPTEEECSQQRRMMICDLISRAAPHLMYNLGHVALNTAQYWGVNLQAAEGRNMDEILMDNTNNTPEVARNVAFSRYELAVYRSVLGLMVSNVKKFVDYGMQYGEYYESYEARLRKISQGFYAYNPDRELSVTPHADARWHMREFLQPLSEERDDEDRRMAARAMWLGVIYGNICLAKNQRANQLCVSYASPKNQGVGAGDRFIPLFYRKEPVKNFNQMYQLYYALLEDNLIKHRLLDVLEPVYQEDAHRFMAVGSSGYNMKGANANRLLRALHDEENAAKPQAGMNVLTLAEDILKLQAMDQRSIAILDKEKSLIVAELMNIINGLQMTDARKKELCNYIAQCSIYRTSVASRARDAQFLPDFHLMDLPSVKVGTSGKQKEESAKTEATEKKPNAKKTAPKKEKTPKKAPVKAKSEQQTAAEKPAEKKENTAGKTASKKTASRKAALKKETAPEATPAKAEGEKKSTARRSTKKTQE